MVTGLEEIYLNVLFSLEFLEQVLIFQKKTKNKTFCSNYIFYDLPPDTPASAIKKIIFIIKFMINLF